ncbi:DUF1127 domain-containing protein [Bradyrhizobium ontarionense]|uniref:DUF1127 domain-containing protein n=1 Tax=Bradyrhizobium ontarionense TaxID=2898149 RepID=A0ABY3RH19_9BRAD|nr:DUF1127 domain-containing protein [Bradyrhizobium sp. A19]UFZ06240.1 DUF1127 domain-containing protein [Bradyrhizobium sp. A19]
MPPHQTSLTAEIERDAAGLGLDRPIASTKNITGGVPAAPRPDASIAALRDALSEKDAAGPPAAAAPSVLSLLTRYWLAFQDSRRRRRMRVSLRDLSESQLMDIGLTPGDIDYIAAHRAVERVRDSMTYQLMCRGVM